MMLFWTLFSRFFLIGLFTIGGGYAMLPLIQRVVVVDNAWITEEMFENIVAVSQMTPGPIGINSATYIGHSVVKAAGFGEFWCICGSFTATLAVVLPSFLIVLALCHAYSKFNHSKIFTGTMMALRPTVAGLIGAAAMIMITPENFGDWKSLILFGAAFLCSFFRWCGPIVILIAAGVVGYALYG